MSNVEQITKRTVREAIEHYIKNPPENSRVFTITPKDAEWILNTYNSGNRNKKSSKIAVYADDMKTGNWGLTGDTLKFSNTGVLSDGQNRLHGCVRSSTSFRTHIVFGIDRELFTIMDRGKPRSSGDALKIAGFTSTGILGQACRWVALLDNGRAKQRDSYEPAEILEMLRTKYPKLPDFIPYGTAIHRNVGSPAGMTAAILYLASQRRPNDWTEFARIWELGGQDKKGGSLKKMLAKITVIASAAHGRVHDTVRAALAVTAWNLYVQNKSGTKSAFEWSLDDKFPDMRTR